MRGLATQQILEEQYGRPRHLQTIAAVTAGTSFRSAAIAPGSRLLIQPSGAGNFKVGDSTVVASAADSVGLAAGEKFYVCLKTTDTHVAFVPTASNGLGGYNIFLME